MIPNSAALLHFLFGNLEILKSCPKVGFTRLKTSSDTSAPASCIHHTCRKLCNGLLRLSGKTYREAVAARSCQALKFPKTHRACLLLAVSHPIALAIVHQTARNSPQHKPYRDHSDRRRVGQGSSSRNRFATTQTAIDPDGPASVKTDSVDCKVHRRRRKEQLISSCITEPTLAG